MMRKMTTKFDVAKLEVPRDFLTLFNLLYMYIDVKNLARSHQPTMRHAFRTKYEIRSVK